VRVSGVRRIISTGPQDFKSLSLKDCTLAGNGCNAEQYRHALPEDILRCCANIIPLTPDFPDKIRDGYAGV
jgi:hypothetical protein